MYRYVLAAVLLVPMLTHAQEPTAQDGAGEKETAHIESAQEPPIEEETPSDIATAAELVVTGVIDLETAQHIALRDNPSLRAAAERIAQAKARVRQVRSEWFPQLGTSAVASASELPDSIVDEQVDAIRRAQLVRVGALVDASMNNLPAVGAGLITIGADLRDALHALDDTSESYRASITADWLVFDGFGRKFRNVAAKYAQLEFEEAFLDSQRLILSAVAFAYYNVQLARENFAIAQADRAFNQRQLGEAEARRRVGTGSLSDVLNFEIRVRAADTNVVQSDRNYRVALIALAELMGLPQEDTGPQFEVAELFEEQPEEMEEQNPEPHVVVALENRPDLRLAGYTMQRAEAGVKIERSTYFPSVRAFASEDAFSDENVGFDKDDFGGTIGIRVDYDIYTGGRRKASVAEARSVVKETELLQDDAAFAVAAEVRRAVETLRTAQEELVIQRDTTQYVERQLDLVDKEYRGGQGSLVRLNEAQRDLIAQQSRLALARVALRLSWHDLRTATAQTLAGFSEGEPEMDEGDVAPAPDPQEVLSEN